MNQFDEESIFNKVSESNIKRISLISPFILLSLSYVYLLFYYTRFEINIFEYLTLDSFIILSLLPIGISVYVSVISVYLYVMEKIVFDKLKEFQWRKFYEILSLILFSFFKNTIFVLPIILVRKQFDLTLSDITVLFLIITGISGLIIFFETSNKTRMIIYTLSVSLSVIIYMSYLKGDRIIKKESYQYILESDIYSESNSNHHYMIIGYVNNRYFLKPVDSSFVVIKKFPDNFPLTVRNFQSTK